MSETVKLIIEIPKEDYEWAKQIAQTRNESVYCERQIVTIANGIPLDSNDSDRAEAQAYFDGQAYGWEQGRKALIDDVKAKIDNEWANTHHMYPDYASGLACASEIIDRCIGKAESEE